MTSRVRASDLHEIRIAYELCDARGKYDARWMTAVFVSLSLYISLCLTHARDCPVRLVWEKEEDINGFFRLSNYQLC